MALANELLPHCILVQYGYIEARSTFTMASGSQEGDEYMVRYHRSVDWLGQRRLVYIGVAVIPGVGGTDALAVAIVLVRFMRVSNLTLTLPLNSKTLMPYDP